MNDAELTIARWIRIGAPVHAVALSDDGRYLLTGSEHDLRLLDRWGHEWFRYSTPDQDLPFSLVALTPGASWGLALERSGQLHRIDITQQVETLEVSLQVLWNEPNDICSLGLAPDAGLIALGHFGPALTMINLEGQQAWRLHPNDRTATDGQTWSVALRPSGDRLYVGCSGGARPVIAALDASTGDPRAAIRPGHRVTGLANMPEPLAVAAILNNNHVSQIAAYSSDLKSPHWVFEGAANEQFTALTVDMEANLVACGTNTGAIYLLDGNSGALLAVNSALRSTVYSLSMAGGRYVIAGLQDGQVAYLEYLPQQEGMMI